MKKTDLDVEEILKTPAPTYERVRFLPADIATLAYLLVLSLLILIWHQNLKDWYLFLIYNLAFCLVILAIIYLWSDAERGWRKFLRHLYPMLLFTFLYEETGYLVHLIVPNWLDLWVNKLELGLFGVYPTVALEKISFPVLNDFMSLGYISYYFLLPVLGINLYWKKKIKEIDYFLFTTCVTFYISYLGFIFFPVEGPYKNLLTLHSQSLEGYIFTPFAQYIIDNAAIHGGCMPSSHVAVALIVLIFAFKYTKVLRWVMTPFVLTLFVSTFYCRFHYLTDMVAGLLIGWAVFIISQPLFKKLEKVLA